MRLYEASYVVPRPPPVKRLDHGVELLDAPGVVGFGLFALPGALLVECRGQQTVIYGCSSRRVPLWSANSVIVCICDILS